MNWESILDTVVRYGLKVIISLVALFVAFKIINAVAKGLVNRLTKSERIDITIARTLIYASKIGMKILVIVGLVGFIGIDTSGLTALIASAGVCAGLAVNGALSNFAGGVLMLITKPFKIGDYIEACGYEGIVEEIKITSTRIHTVDNKVIFIPNGTLSSGSIINHFANSTRRVDLTFNVAYSSDLQKVLTAVLKMQNSHALALKDPEPQAMVGKYAESAVEIVARTWVKSEDYWTVYFDLIEQIKKEFDREGIKVPFNHLDVHICNDNEK